MIFEFSCSPPGLLFIKVEKSMQLSVLASDAIEQRIDEFEG